LLSTITVIPLNDGVVFSGRFVIFMLFININIDKL